MRPFLSQAPPAATPASQGLSQEEATEIAGWGVRERRLFLLGYQWLSAMTSPRLKVFGTDAGYIGLLPTAIKAIQDILSAGQPVMTKLPPESLSGFTELKTAAEEAAKTSGSIADAIRRWRPLRNSVTDQFVAENMSIEFEYFGDSPTQPNTVVLHRAVEEGVPPDFSAAFSTKTPAELIEDGIKIQDMYQEIGAVLPGFPILGTLNVLIGNVLAFFSAYERVQEERNFNDEVLSAIENDTVLTPAQKTEATQKVNGAQAILANVFSGAPFPWASLVIAGALVAGVAFLGPELWSRKPNRKKK